jgi:hypothetical protein
VVEVDWRLVVGTLDQVFIDFAMMAACCVALEFSPSFTRTYDGIFGPPLLKRNKVQFRDAYRAGLPVRLAVALIAAILFGLVGYFAKDDLALIFTFWSELAGYVLLVIYYMWCAETDHKPWA